MHKYFNAGKKTTPSTALALSDGIYLTADKALAAETLQIVLVLVIYLF